MDARLSASAHALIMRRSRVPRRPLARTPSFLAPGTANSSMPLTASLLDAAVGVNEPNGLHRRSNEVMADPGSKCQVARPPDLSRLRAMAAS